MAHATGAPPCGDSERIEAQFRVVDVAWRVPRDRVDVAEVDVQVVIGLAGASTVRSRPDAGQRVARDLRVPLDRGAVVEEGVADAIDVRRRGPAVSRRV